MKPLQGVRIVSVEQFGAGPYATMLLADLGAEVIKVENAAIGGDPSRKTGPFMLGANDSEYYQAFNINKKSVSVDLRTDEGKATLRELAATADALLNNLRGDLPAKLGLEYKSMSEVNPKLVCVHLSAYGRNNERASWPGYDYLMQAESGLMDLTGEPDKPPARLGAPSIIDQTTGLTAAVGLLSAIVQARSTGKGCDVDTCLLDVALHQLGYTATWYLNEGHVSKRQRRSAHYSVAPVQTFPTTDGWLFVMCMTDKFWNEFVGGIGRPDLLTDPRFATPTTRQTNRDVLTEIIDGVSINYQNTDDNNRVADDGTDSESQVIFPRYTTLADLGLAQPDALSNCQAVIFAAEATTGIVDSENKPISWIELQPARVWARRYAQ